MKALIKLSLLLAVTSGVLSCNRVDDGSRSSTFSSSSETSENIRVEIPADEYDPKGTSISLEDLTSQANGFESKSFSRVRITYQARETMIGSAPYYMSGGQTLIPDGSVLDSEIIIEATSFSNGNGSFRKVSANYATENPRFLESGVTLTMKSWLSYHNEKRRNYANAEEGKGFEEELFFNPYLMWMKNYNNRPENASVDGFFYYSEEYLREFNADGYVTKICFTNVTVIDGTLSKWDSEPTNYKGVYKMVCQGIVEYFNE